MKKDISIIATANGKTLTFKAEVINNTILAHLREMIEVQKDFTTIQDVVSTNLPTRLLQSTQEKLEELKEMLRDENCKISVII